ncbi:MAG TPA: hypothetical protein VIU40_14025 [Geobacteraceae bacterium]
MTEEEYPPLTIVLLTYSESVTGPRARYAKRTLEAVRENLRYSGPIYLHIADDGSPSEHVKKLIKLTEGWDLAGYTVSNSKRAGYGANWNIATQFFHPRSGIVLPLEDDWELPKPLSIDGYVRTLTTPEAGINCIRLGYLGFTNPLFGVLRRHGGITYLLLDADSPETHVCSGHPRLETVPWERAVGPWDEGHDPGWTERLWCERRQARMGIAWPMDAPTWGTFAHIGTVQAREDQREPVA